MWGGCAPPPPVASELFAGGQGVQAPVPIADNRESYLDPDSAGTERNLEPPLK